MIPLNSEECMDQKYHEDVAKDPVNIAATKMRKTLESNISLETAMKVVVVAMTNCQATDVLAADGNSYDQSKFHSYKDIGDFFLTIEKE